MSPAEVYETLCRERERLRGVLANVTGSVASTCSSVELRDHAYHLRSAVVSYSDLEDRLLPEVLPWLDAWGGERLRRMRSELCERRRVVAYDLARIDGATDCDATFTRSAVVDLAARVMQSLAAEAEQVVRADVLTNDCVNTDEFGG